MAILAQLIDGVVAHKFDINADGLRIGRLPENDVIIDDTSVSSLHAEIQCIPNPDFPEVLEFYISDLGSTNGTEVNGEALSTKHQLSHGDEIKIAWNSFKFVNEDSPNMAKTMHILK